jgi:hypothetical protein
MYLLSRHPSLISILPRLIRSLINFKFQKSLKMKFTPLFYVLAGAVLVNSSPVLETKAEDVVEKRDIEVVYEGCDVITPKVFIISMVRVLL